jgi:SAM-dependent methyltransferase
MITQPFSSLVTRVFDSYWNFFPNHIAPQIHELFCKEKDNNIEETLLDVCCGSGHFGKYFLEKGFSVTGIDLSDKAIELAQEKTKHFGSKASWIKGNASDFDLGQKFSLAVSTFDSLNYLEDLNALESCFKCVDNHLLDKGFFLFDLYTAMGMKKLNNISVDESETLTSIFRGYYDGKSEKAFLKISGFLKTNDQLYERFEDNLTLYVFQINLVEKMLRENNFKDVRYYQIGSDKLKRIEFPENLERVMIYARKN